MPQLWLIVLISFNSCSTVRVVDADIPPLPKMENVPKGEPQSEREAILERNFILLGLWAEKVVKFNT